MSLRIAQDSEYAGKDYWKWRAWIEGKTDELLKVEKVKWFLHPSFTPSVIVSRERASGFRLEASGWGTFLLRAELRLVDGTDVTLRHHLEFAKPNDTPRPPEKSPFEENLGERTFIPAPPQAAPPKAEPPQAAPSVGPAPEKPAAAKPAAPARKGKVFLSYGSEDRPTALALRRALEALGISVLDDSQISAGAPLEIAALDLISRADATIACVSSDLPSTFVAQEVNASIRAGKPTLVVTREKLGSILGIDAAVPIRQLDASDSGAIAAALKTLKL